MNAALSLGPLSLPYTVLLVVLAITLALWLSERQATRQGVPAPPLGLMLLLAAAAARLAFVLHLGEVARATLAGHVQALRLNSQRSP